MRGDQREPDSQEVLRSGDFDQEILFQKDPFPESLTSIGMELLHYAKSFYRVAF